MRKLNVFIALILMSIFCLTSCQKDTMENVSTETQITQNNIEGPQSLMEKQEGETEDFSQEIINKLISGGDEITVNRDKAVSRNGEDEIEILGVSASTKVRIDCGDYLISSNNTYNNNFTDHFYASRGFNSNLNGGDNIYAFTPIGDMKTTFSLRTQGSNRQNLAMFLFEGDYDDVNHRAYVRNVVAWSTSQSRYSEELKNISLKRGRQYILVVDSAPNRGCDYNLRVSCIGTGIPQPATCDDFDHYSNGYLTSQNPTKYEKWDFNSKDAEVQGGSNKYIYFARDPYSGQSTQADVIYKTGRVRSGRKTLSMNMWIYRGHSGYFNIQKRLRHEYGAEVYFHDGGHGELKIGGRAYNFRYPQNRWFTVEMDFDFHSQRVKLKVDNSLVRSWPTRYTVHSTSGSQQIEGVDFYVPKSDSEFWVDDLCFQ